MNCGVETGSGAMMYIPSVTKISSGIHEGDTQTHTDIMEIA